MSHKPAISLFTNLQFEEDRYMRQPVVILSGSTLTPQPRPPPPLTPVINTPEEVGPAFVSENMKAPRFCANDIFGWEETNDQILVSDATPVTYVSCDTPVDPVQEIKKMKKRIYRSRKAKKTIKYLGEQEVEEDESTPQPPIPPTTTIQQQNSAEQAYSILIENTRNLKLEKRPTSEKPKPRSQFDFLSAPATDKMALLRKRLISSATSARQRYVYTQPDLGMAVLKGQKYSKIVRGQDSLPPIINDIPLRKKEERTTTPFQVPKWVGKRTSVSRESEQKVDDMLVICPTKNEWIPKIVETQRPQVAVRKRSFRTQIAISRGENLSV